MNPITQFLLTLLIAAIGGLLGHKFKLPMGAMLGAMIATASYNVIAEPVLVMPDSFRLLFQIPLGVMIGSQVRKHDLLELRRLGKSALVVIGCFFVFNLLSGLSVYAISEFNAVTALFATAPGGAVYMAIIAEHIGGSVATVAILQMFRNSSVLIFIAPFYRKLLSKRYGQAIVAHEVPHEQLDTACANTKNSATTPAKSPSAVPSLLQCKHFAVTLGFSLVFGLGFGLLAVPAGEMVGAMIGAVVYNVLTGKAQFLPILRVPIRILSGFFVGVNMTRLALAELATVPVVLLVIFGYIWLTTYVTAFLVHKLTGLDFASSLLASTPGGMSEMALIADDLNIGAPKVAVIHTIRLMSVISFFPPMLLWVLGMLG